MHLDKASVFTDLAGLQNIKQLPKGESEEALQAVAKQFESIFINMMMKSMRDSNAVFEEGSLTGSSEQKFYRDMFDQQLSLTLSSGRGIGLAEVLVRQLSQSGAGPRATLDSARLSPSVPKNPQGEVSAEVVKEKGEQSDAPGFDSPQAFVNYLLPKAEKVARQLGLDPRFMVSQAALETGWGQKIIPREDGSHSFNLFGIKADNRWQGDIARVSTLEYRNGLAQREQASFRAYNSFDESLEDFVDFLRSNERYQKALSKTHDPEQFVHELQRAGYATDPAYAEKINDIANGEVFGDSGEKGVMPAQDKGAA